VTDISQDSSVNVWLLTFRPQKKKKKKKVFDFFFFNLWLLLGGNFG